MGRRPAGSGQGSTGISTSSLRKCWISVSEGTWGAPASCKLRPGQQKHCHKQLGQALFMKQLGPQDMPTRPENYGQGKRSASTGHLCRHWGLGSLCHNGRREVLQIHARGSKSTSISQMCRRRDCVSAADTAGPQDSFLTSILYLT